MGCLFYGSWDARNYQKHFNVFAVNLVVFLHADWELGEFMLFSLVSIWGSDAIWFHNLCLVLSSDRVSCSIWHVLLRLRWFSPPSCSPATSSTLPTPFFPAACSPSVHTLSILIIWVLPPKLNVLLKKWLNPSIEPKKLKFWYEEYGVHGCQKWTIVETGCKEVC